MSGTESNSVGCSKLIEIKGCAEPKMTKQGKQYVVDTSKEPKIIFKDAIGNAREMKFKRNCTVTITHEKILYNREDVEIKPVTLT
ncbi:MAG: hypothetical protein KGI25_08805 [Thaumarchaeota archaeon]|nr:hypothetical protein [Nitrososphaerota archaeon]